MSRHMGNRHRLPGGEGGKLCSAGHFAGRRVCSDGGFVSLLHRDLTSDPSVRQFDRPAWTVIARIHFFEEVQHVLCALGRPHCKEVVMRVQ
jgi:hypothetical protein